MAFQTNDFYHIYNQGNNKQKVFYEEENYTFFISLMEKFVQPYCDILSWCLMPNHFHFLVQCNEKSVEPKNVGNIQLTMLSNGVRMLQSRYSLAFNKQNGQTGSIFRQRSKAKAIDAVNSDSYLKTCFNYIHQNPLKSGLVNKMEDWPYSSFKEFIGISSTRIANVVLAEQVLDLDMKLFYDESYRVINEDLLDGVF